MSRDKFVRLVSLLRGEKIFFAPTAPILFDHKLIEMFARLLSLQRGDKRDYVPTSPI